MKKALPFLFMGFVLFQTVSAGWLGIVIQDINPNLSIRFGLRVKAGALIMRVQFGSPADKAGLMEGDVIVVLNDKKIPDSRALQQEISKISPGGKAKITLIRHRREKVIEVFLGETPRDVA
ncbi:MAG: PDZ domain-containing protein [Nitrospiria bacterium]